MRFLYPVFTFVFIFCSCASKHIPEPTTPEIQTVPEQAEELSMLPEYVPPSGAGEIAEISKGETSPVDGVVLDEEAATKVAELRIAYDEVYRLAESDRKFLMNVVYIQDDEIRKADRTIEKKNDKIDELTNSWWARNKFSVGTSIGIVLGIALTIATGKIWAEVERGEDR